jgi:hypothetical protein
VRVIRLAATGATRGLDRCAVSAVNMDGRIVLNVTRHAVSGPDTTMAHQ